MKLILLRHEKRENYPGFFSNLTEEGKKDATKLVKQLNKLHIDVIYCSPLVRTLQTISPYCKKNNVKVHIEYGLYEYKHYPYFLFEPKIYGLDDINDKDLTSIVNKRCRSKIKKCNFEYSSLLETESDLEKRLSIFLHSIRKNHKLKNKTILFVSHLGVIHKIKRMLNKNITVDDDFEMGHYEILKL